MKLLEMGNDKKIKHSVSPMRNNDEIMQGEKKSFTNAFSSNLNTVNLKISPEHGGRHT